MIRFFKMNGVGNDYIFIDNTQDKTLISKKVIKNICNRHFGVGGDGVVILTKSKVCDVKMRIYNLDSSNAKLCGNATRCVAFYMCKKLGKNNISVQSGEKVLYCKVESMDKDSAKVSVNMGKAKITSRLALNFKSQKYQLYVVDIGNLHCVTFVKDFNFDIEKFCKEIQSLPYFEKGVNVDLVKVKGESLEIKVCERGSGFTLACGSGACASAYVAFCEGLVKNNVCVIQDGGKLDINIDENITMLGDCQYVFDGVFYEDK